MGTAVKILPQYTYSDYRHWEGSWELIEGIPHAMSPAPVPKHQYIATNIGGELRNLIKATGCKKCRASQAIDYLIADDTVVQPDVLVYCGQPDKPYLDFAPVLVTEILSPSTAMKDRHTKFRLYEKAGVKWYIIVNPEMEVVQVYTLKKEEYILVNEGHDFSQSFDFEEDCFIQLDFADIWQAGCHRNGK